MAVPLSLLLLLAPSHTFLAKESLDEYVAHPGCTAPHVVLASRPLVCETPTVSCLSQHGGHADASLVRRGAECNAPSRALGFFARLQQCADRCLLLGGCRYFSFGRAGTPRAGECYEVRTKGATCPEGWAADTSFDFFALSARAAYAHCEHRSQPTPAEHGH